MSPTSRPADRNLRFALARLSPSTAGTLASDGDGEGDRDAAGVSLGIPAGMVEDVEAGSAGTRRPIPSRRTVPAVTTVFTIVDVP
jgi:hypothetical protein